MVNVLYMSMTFFRAVPMPSTKYCCCILIALVHVGASQNNGMVTSHLKEKKSLFRLHNRKLDFTNQKISNKIKKSSGLNALPNPLNY